MRAWLEACKQVQHLDDLMLAMMGAHKLLNFVPLHPGEWLILASALRGIQGAASVATFARLQLCGLAIKEGKIAGEITDFALLTSDVLEASGVQHGPSRSRHAAEAMAKSIACRRRDVGLEDRKPMAYQVARN